MQSGTAILGVFALDHIALPVSAGVDKRAACRC